MPICRTWAYPWSSAWWTWGLRTTTSPCCGSCKPWPIGAWPCNKAPCARRSACCSAAAPPASGRRGGSGSPASPPTPRTAGRPAAPTRRARGPGPGRRVPARRLSLWRLFPGWPALSHPQDAAPALEPCAGQPSLRLPGHRALRRLQLLSKRPSLSPNPLFQRSRGGPAGRGRVSSGRIRAASRTFSATASNTGRDLRWARAARWGFTPGRPRRWIPSCPSSYCICGCTTPAPRSEPCMSMPLPVGCSARTSASTPWGS